MRLRRQRWIDEAIENYGEWVLNANERSFSTDWSQSFGCVAPLHVEIGTGKGAFLAQMAEAHPSINFLGIEASQDILYYAAKKAEAAAVTNLRLLVFDANHLIEIFKEHSVARLYLNFSDPWPKKRHAKRRLTYRDFLAKYRHVLVPGGQIWFKTDNRDLFDFSLEEFEASGLEVQNCTYDLHQTDFHKSGQNKMTEYEVKFSEKGQKICRCEVLFD